MDGVLLAGLAVARGEAVDVAVGVALQAGGRAVVDDGGAVFGGGHGEMNEEAGIVELAVVVDDAAAQLFGLEGGQALEGLLARKQARCAEAVLAGEQVVELEADAVEGRLPPGVVGNDEGEIVDQVRRVLAKQAALFQGRHDERDVALLQVANAAVDELGGAAAGSFTEVVGLDENYTEAARGGIHGNAHAGCAAADDGDVPGLAVVRADLRSIWLLSAASSLPTLTQSSFGTVDGSLPAGAAGFCFGFVHLRLEAGVGVAFGAEIVRGLPRSRRRGRQDRPRREPSSR